MKRNTLNPRLMFMTAPVEGGAPAAPAVPAQKQGTPADKEKSGEGDQPLREPDLKALQAERERAAKAEKERDDLKKQIEDASKTAEQRAADDLIAARDAAAGATLLASKYEIAAEVGLDLKLATRLTGSTADELRADAANLKNLVGATPAGIPRPDPSQGGGSSSPAKGVSAGRELYNDRRKSK